MMDLNSSEVSQTMDITEHLGPRATLISLHGGTLLTLWFYTYIIYTKVEIRHPVFAIIFQEAAVLSLTETVSFVYILATAVDYEMHSPCMFTQIVLHMFHQWSWLVITCLRYSNVYVVQLSQRPH